MVDVLNDSEIVVWLEYEVGYDCDGDGDDNDYSLKDTVDFFEWLLTGQVKGLSRRGSSFWIQVAWLMVPVNVGCCIFEFLYPDQSTQYSS